MLKYINLIRNFKLEIEKMEYCLTNKTELEKDIIEKTKHDISFLQEALELRYWINK